MGSWCYHLSQLYPDSRNEYQQVVPHICPKVVDDWFDLVLREGQAPLILLSQMEEGWQKNLLEVEYYSSVEESYTSLSI